MLILLATILFACVVLIALAVAVAVALVTWVDPG